MSLRIVPPTGAAPQPGDCAALAPVAAALPPGDTTTPQSADTAAPQPGDSAAPQPASATRGAQASNTHASQAPRYWAFISYSHRDEKLAKSLQRKLETYRLPKRLVGRDGAHGPVPAQAKPVFRDRDELHAGTDLAAHVQAALATSRWLVVLCTPNAARSPWVEREIVAFKRLHGEGRVLALIAAGEPFASRLPGREEEECFPNALRHALGPQGEADGADQEPIAADMRLHGDGPRRAARGARRSSCWPAWWAWASTNSCAATTPDACAGSPAWPAPRPCSLPCSRCSPCWPYKPATTHASNASRPKA